MGRRKKQFGFTIVEVSLVLAISSALAVAILATATISINQQRYNDAVMTLLSRIQREYVATTRVVNGGEDGALGTWCNAPRGTTECLILGRFIAINSAGTQMTTGNIYGIPPTTDNLPSGDIAALQTYNFESSYDTESTSTLSTQALPWNVRIELPERTGDSTLNILMLRSPLSGSVLTFVGTSDKISGDDTGDLVNLDYMVQRTMCIDAQGLSPGPTNAVVIRERASSPNGVTQLLEGNGCL
ncbi:MAG: PulJ/GspJ family protein [Candidatus Saccharimonadales bacterium]